MLKTSVYPHMESKPEDVKVSEPDKYHYCNGCSYSKEIGKLTSVTMTCTNKVLVNLFNLMPDIKKQPEEEVSILLLMKCRTLTARDGIQLGQREK